MMFFTLFFIYNIVIRRNNQDHNQLCLNKSAEGLALTDFPLNLVQPWKKRNTVLIKQNLLERLIELLELSGPLPVWCEKPLIVSILLNQILLLGSTLVR